MTAAEARTLALSLPEAVEAEHHGRPSFRVRNKIFATLWTDRALNVMAGGDGILTAVQSHPDVCAKVHWGEQLAAVRVDLPAADPDIVEGLLVQAWVRKAPKTLVERSGLFT